MRCETSNCVGAARLLSLSNVSERLRIHLRLRLWVRAMASTASAAATKFSCRPAGRSLEIRIAYLDSAARCLPVACGRSGAKPGARPSLAAGFSRELDNCRCASGCRYNGGAAVADLLRASERASERKLAGPSRRNCHCANLSANMSKPRKPRAEENSNRSDLQTDGRTDCGSSAANFFPFFTCFGFSSVSTKRQPQLTKSAAAGHRHRQPRRQAATIELGGQLKRLAGCHCRFRPAPPRARRRRAPNFRQRKPLGANGKADRRLNWAALPSRSPPPPPPSSLGPTAPPTD